MSQLSSLTYYAEGAGWVADAPDDDPAVGKRLAEKIARRIGGTVKFGG